MSERALDEEQAQVSPPGEGASADAVPRRAMTVSEAGRKGGLAVRDERGHAFYEEIGRKGGQRVRELVARGKARS